MLGIWHGGEWMKRDLAHPFYGQVERGSPITSWIFHHQYEVIYPCISMSIIMAICGLYGYDFVGIFDAVMLVVYMFYDIIYVSISSFVY